MSIALFSWSLGPSFIYLFIYFVYKITLAVQDTYSMLSISYIFFFYIWPIQSFIQHEWDSVQLCLFVSLLMCYSDKMFKLLLSPSACTFCVAQKNDATCLKTSIITKWFSCSVDKFKTRKTPAIKQKHSNLILEYGVNQHTTEHINYFLIFFLFLETCLIFLMQTAEKSWSYLLLILILTPMLNFCLIETPSNHLCYFKSLTEDKLKAIEDKWQVKTSTVTATVPCLNITLSSSGSKQKVQFSVSSSFLTILSSLQCAKVVTTFLLRVVSPLC